MRKLYNWCGYIEHGAENMTSETEMFLYLVDKCKIKPKDLGISSNYLYKIRKGLKKPSQDLIRKVIMLCNESMGPRGFEPRTTGAQAPHSSQAKLRPLTHSF